MRKVILIFSAIAFIISMDTCYFILATEPLNAFEKSHMKLWQWVSIGLYAFILQALMYDCRMQTRVEKLLLIIASSTFYYTIAVICLVQLQMCSNPYTQIISFNTIAFILISIISIAAIYSGTFKIGLTFKKSNKI